MVSALGPDLLDHNPRVARICTHVKVWETILWKLDLLSTISLDFCWGGETMARLLWMEKGSGIPAFSHSSRAQTWLCSEAHAKPLGSMHRDFCFRFRKFGWGPRICISNESQVTSMQLVGDHTSGCSGTDSDNTCALSLPVLSHSYTCDPPFPGLPQDLIGKWFNHRLPERGFSSTLTSLSPARLFPVSSLLFTPHLPSAFLSWLCFLYLFIFLISFVGFPNAFTYSISRFLFLPCMS